MPRTPSRLAPQVDALEARLALATMTAAASTVADSTLTPAEYLAARVQINIAVIRQALTGNQARADLNLERSVRQLPDGANLLPTLQIDLNTTDLSVRGAARATRQRLFDNLDTFIRASVATGDLTVAGRALRHRFPTPLGQSTSYYYPVSNQTGQAINFIISQTGNPLLPTTAAISNTSSPAPISYSANATPPPVIATVTPQNGSGILVQAVVPAVVNNVEVVNNNGSYSLLFNFNP